MYARRHRLIFTFILLIYFYIILYIYIYDIHFLNYIYIYDIHIYNYLFIYLYTTDNTHAHIRACIYDYIRMCVYVSYAIINMLHYRLCLHRRDLQIYGILFFFLLLYVQGYCYKEKKLFKNLSMPRVYIRVRVWAREYCLSRKSYMIFRNINILTC